MYILEKKGIPVGLGLVIVAWVYRRAMIKCIITCSYPVTRGHYDNK